MCTYTDWTLLALTLLVADMSPSRAFPYYYELVQLISRGELSCSRTTQRLPTPLVLKI